MLVYLADLRHNTITLTPDAMPLSIGFLAAYGSKMLGPDVQFKLFADAEHLLEELGHTKPDVLAVTNYCWNYQLQCRTLRHVRGLYPDVLTVMGGPNISLSPEGEEARLRQTPGLDLYVVNEGDESFVDMLSRYLDSGLRKSRLFQEPLPSAIFVDPDSGQVVRGNPTPRMRQLDDIPSPYLMGFMDQFFEADFCPMIQTNRGCPFTCTFCVEGVSYMTKVNKFSLERVREELNYIGHHASVGSALMISDSNFGMLPGDLDTAQCIHELQTKIGWPKFVWATTGKNNKEAILSAIDLLGGSMSMTNSVQSLDPTVLANIKRSNIKLETYDSILREVEARNLQSYSEVIIGLPGETLESFVRGVSRLLDSGVQRVCCYQLMLLDGTELSSEATRENHGLETKFRVLSRDFGVYASEHVFETEEIVVATNTMSYQDYRECRKLQLIMEVYHREGLLREFLEYLNKHDVQISAFMLDLLDHLGEAPNEVRGLFEDYMSEADNELFDSREQVHQTMAANYESLVTEDVGGNLVQKYSALAWFKRLDPVLQYAVQRVKSLVLKGSDQDGDAAGRVDSELEAIRQYLLASMINITDITSQLEPLKVSLDYDVDGWGNQGYQQPLSDLRHHQIGYDNGAGQVAREYVFYVPEAHAAYLEDKLRMHGASTQAMGKLLSRVLLRDLRREVQTRHD